MKWPWNRKRDFVKEWDRKEKRPYNIPIWGYILVMFIFFAGLVKLTEWASILVVSILEYIV